MANESYICDGCELVPALKGEWNPSGRYCPGHNMPGPRFDDFEQYCMMQRLGADMTNDALVAVALKMPGATVRAIRESLPGMRQLFKVKA